MLSIGALSAATGVPVETIRSWERRYGFPVAERKPSGHRVYPLSVVPRVQLISKALARGLRAAEVVSAPESALESFLVALPSLAVSAVGVVVSMAVASGARGAEAVVVLTDAEVSSGDIDIVRDFGGTGVPGHRGTPAGLVGDTHST
jgi:hypothetical protein